MNDYLLGAAIMLGGAGVGLIFAPAHAFHRIGLQPPQTTGDARIYRLGGSLLIGLAAIVLYLIVSE